MHSKVADLRKQSAEIIYVHALEQHTSASTHRKELTEQGHLTMPTLSTDEAHKSHCEAVGEEECQASQDA
jgi:hypothetical protein